MIHEDGAIAYQEQNEECKSSVFIFFIIVSKHEKAQVMYKSNKV